MQEPKPIEDQPIQDPPPAPSPSSSPSPPKSTEYPPPTQSPEQPPPSAAITQTPDHHPPPPPPSTDTTQTLDPQPPPEMAPSTVTTLPPPPPATQVADPPKSRKRALETDHTKIRLIVRDLRPRVLEVLRAPDFWNCKAAQEIREELNALRKLCKETVAVNNGVAQKPQSQVHDVKPAHPRPENGETTSYIVGGSAFGWNFITYVGNDAVYYGRTKEAFRIIQTTQQ